MPQVPSTVNFNYGMFDTTTILESYQIRFPVPSFVRDAFFTARDYPQSDVVRIDSMIGGRVLAPFVLPLEGQIVGRRRPWKESYIKAPILAPARVITLREATRPGRGETMYSWKSPEERIAQYIADDGDDMDDEIARREEWMCCQCMFTGQVPVNYRNKTSVVIDYGFTNKTALTKPWTDPSTFPLNDLMAAQQGLNAWGYSGNLAIYSPDAWNALWTNPNFQALMKNTPGFVPVADYVLGQSVPEGVQKAPSFTYPTMENWIYSATYQVADSSMPYVPKGCVLIGSRNIENTMVYALVTQIEQADGKFHSYSMDRVPKMECNVNKNFFMYTMTSRPVPLPKDLMSWTVITGAA